MSLTLCFSKPRHWALVSWVIEKFTKSEVSHATIGTDLHGVPVILQATAGGVQITPRDHFEVADEIVEEYEPKMDLSDELPDAIEKIGLRYNYLELILGFPIVILLWRLFKVKIKNPFHSTKAMVCSEFVLHLDDKDHKVSEFKDLIPEDTTPQDLLDRIKSGNSFTKIK